MVRRPFIIRHAFWLSFILLFTLPVHAIIYSTDSSFISATWSRNDRICAYTTSNDRIVLSVLGLYTDGHTATLTGNGWTLADQETYYAYQPYNPNYVVDGNPMTSLPVSYTNQLQRGNANTAHLSTYDYMTAQSTATDQMVNFNFQHLGAILCFSMEMSQTADIISLSLSPSISEFPSDAIMDVTTATLRPTTFSSCLTLHFIETQVFLGESFVAYMMLPPILSSNDYTLTVITSVATYSVVFPLSSIEPGKCYVINTQSTPSLKFFPQYACCEKAENVKEISATISDFETITPSIVTTIPLLNPHPSISVPFYSISGIKSSDDVHGIIVTQNKKIIR